MDMNYREGMWEGGGVQSGVKVGKWDYYNCTVNKYILKKLPVGYKVFQIPANPPERVHYTKTVWPWLVWLSRLSTGLQTKGLPVCFSVRAHIWVGGQVPSWGCTRGNHTLMFLSLSFSFPSPLAKNK